MAYVNNPAAAAAQNNASAAFIPAAAALASAANAAQPAAGAAGNAHGVGGHAPNPGAAAGPGPGQPAAAAAANTLALLNMSNLINQKDSRWLQLEVCREFQRNKCSRPNTECKFAHPTSNVEVQNGKVTACYDSIKVRPN